jgi:hypothetical protein
LLVAAATFSSGCIAVGYGGQGMPAMGLLYTEVYGPVSAGSRVGSKEGTACAQSVLGLVATGDASIKEAARDGGITKIDSVDHYNRSILGIIGDFCTIVRGS